jgi:GAF domain-containing protein
LLALILDTIPAEHGAILLTGDSSEEVLYSEHSYRTAGCSGPAILSRTVIERVLTDKVSLLSNDVMEQSGLRSAESLLLAMISSVLVAPLVASRRALGVIYLEIPQIRKRASTSSTCSY